ncbi:MAG: hypothetical protein IPK63_01810 [Candidatus Competibacteraceae bacterium]|nr:hypothetical protein [Candidatus Competibacteraceae bacterium]
MKISYALFVILCLGLGACTVPIPVEKGYPLTYQQKMQSAHHWDVMAIDVADWLRDALIGPPPKPGEKVVVPENRPLVTLFVHQPKHHSDASAGFHNLLTTRLVERGFIVTTNPAGGYPVTYDMQVVTDRLPDIIKHEVIVNVSVMNADRYLIRYSNIYYIGDKGQYIAMQPSPSRIIDMVGCTSGLQCP